MNLATLAQEKASPGGYLLALICIVILAVSLRCGNLSLLRETYALDNDSFRFLRIAEADVAGQPIPKRDLMRWWPTGRDMTTYLSLHSTAMSRIYQIAVRLGLRQPFRSFAIRYPVICYVVCICVLYFMLARYVCVPAGLIAAVGLAITPSTVYRSSVGFIDRDPFCLLLVLCAYAAYMGLLCEREAKWSFGAAVLCGVFSAALGLAWEGVGLFTIAFAVTLAWATIAGRLSGRLLTCHLIWCAIAIPPLLALTHAYRAVQEPYAALALFPGPIVCLSALVITRVRSLGKVYRSLRSVQSGSAAPLPRVLTTVGLLAGVVIGLLPLHPAQAVPALLDSAISICGRGLSELGTDELRNMFLSDWWADWGPCLLLHVAGLGIISTQLGGTGRCWSLTLLALLCAAVILASNDVALWLYPPKAGAEGIRLDGGIPGGIIRLSMLPLWFLGTTALSIGAVWNGKQGQAPGSPLYFFIAVWWFLMLATAVGAVRNSFFCAPAGWAVTGLGLSLLCGWHRARRDNGASRVRLADVLAIVIIAEWARWIVRSGVARTLLDGRIMQTFAVGILAIGSLAVLAFVPRTRRSLLAQASFSSFSGSFSLRRAAAFGLLGFCVVSSTVRAAARANETSPGQLRLFPFLEQMDRCLPRKAVVLSWWDYGSDINVLARRTTVIDEDNYSRAARIADVAREAYCADDPVRAVEFMAKKGVTHWLITYRDLYILPAVARLARIPASVREMSVVDFPRVERTSFASPEAIQFLPGDPSLLPSLMDRLALNALGRPASPVYLSAVRVRLGHRTKTDARWSAPDVEVVLSIGKFRRHVRPEIVVFGGKTVHHEGQVLPGAVLLEGDLQRGPCRAIYIPKRVTKCLAMRLFILNEKLPQFRPVDEIQNSPKDALNVPAARLWEVRYPVVGHFCRKQQLGGLPGRGLKSR